MIKRLRVRSPTDKPCAALYRRYVERFARTAKKVAAELCCQYSGQSQRAVGKYFGYRGNGSVAKQRQRLRELLDADQGLRRELTKLQGILSSE